MKLSQVYARIFDEDEDARVCKDISDNACQATPSSFFYQLISQFFSKLGDALSNTKVVLPWLMQSIGAPAFLIGLLVPIRESGSLIPQLVIGGFIRQQPIRKWFFVVGAALQAISLLLIAVTSFFLKGLQAGLVIIGFLVVFSLARSLCSIASKDVKGKTIPRTRRGRLSGISASLAGLITVFVAGALYVKWLDQTMEFGFLLLVASGCFLFSAISFAAIQEYKGAMDGGKNGFKTAFNNLALLKQDPTFRNFIVVRTLMMSSALSAPYFVLLAQANTATNTWQSLAIFMALSGVASLISGPILGKFADQSSRRLLTRTALMTCLLCCCGAAISHVPALNTVWLSGGLFFLLCVTHEGVRLGRKTYVLDIAQGNKRTDYVAVGNTLIGILLLVIGTVSALFAQHTSSAVLIVFAVMSLLGFLLSTKLPEASQ